MTGTIGIVFSFLWTWIKPILAILVANVTKDVLDLVYQIVVEMSQTDLTNSEKRKTAFEQISYYLQNRGVTIATSTLNLLIELAVAKMKSLTRP
jgi:hypothetical protein